MISIFLVILGILLAILGIIGLFAIAISPLIDDWDVVVRRKDDSLFYSTRFGKWILKQRTKKMAWEYLSFLTIGIVLFFVGMYLGFSDRGKDFWFYKKIYGEEIDRTQWEKITEEGNYQDDEGEVFTNYILIRGKDIYFNGAFEENIIEYDELVKEIKSRNIARENTIALIDSFAISAKYKQVLQLLSDNGYKYKEEVE